MIRTAIFIAAGTLFVGGAAAQSQQNVVKDRTDSAHPQTATAAIPSGAPIEASLLKSLDARKAKQGETVEAQVTENTRQNGKILIPRGAKLEGHVTQVSIDGHSSSSVGIAFDKAILKKGGKIPLNVSLQAVAMPESAASAPTAPDIQPMEAPPSGMARSGAGAPTGNPGAMAPGSTPPDAPNAGANSVSESQGAVGGLSANGRLAPESRGVFGLPGVSLSAGAAEPQPSAVITGKDLRLDSGTQLLLVTRAPAMPPGSGR